MLQQRSQQTRPSEAESPQPHRSRGKRGRPSAAKEAKRTEYWRQHKHRLLSHPSPHTPTQPHTSSRPAAAQGGELLPLRAAGDEELLPSGAAGELLPSGAAGSGELLPSCAAENTGHTHTFRTSPMTSPPAPPPQSSQPAPKRHTTTTTVATVAAAIAATTKAATAVAAAAARISRNDATTATSAPRAPRPPATPFVPFAAARPIPPGHPHLGRIPTGNIECVTAIAHDAPSPSLARSAARFQAASVTCRLCHARFLPPASFAGKQPYCHLCLTVIKAHAKSGDGFIAPRHPSIPWLPPS